MMMKASVSQFTGRLSAPSGARLARAVSALGLVLVTAWLVCPAFAHAVEVWSTDQEFSYGFFIPPVVVLLIG